MDIETILGIVAIVFVVIVFFILIFWELKTKGLKEFTTKMIVKAEDMFNSGDNQKKLDYVIDKVINKLPLVLQIFITRETIKKFVQNVFDMVKEALDYQPKKEG